MGDVVNANLEPGEYVVRRNVVNSIGKDNMELLNQADGAHGALNKLMVSASLVNLQPQDNSPVKIEANGFPIADSPVRQRVDATRNMQKGGEVDFKEHMMYDKNDKGYLAKTYEDHLRMKEMGYSHKGMQEGGEVEEEWSPTTIGGKLQKFLAERKMNKFMEQDPQLKAWYEQPSEIGTVFPAERIESNLYDTQSSINDKVLNDYSRSLSKHTTIEEGSPFEGVKFVDFIEGGADKGRDMQYIETDKGRYRLAKTHQGGLLDPIRNFFGEIPKRVDMDKPYEFETDKPYGVDSDRLSRKDKRDLKTLGRSENLNMQEDLNRLSMASGGMQEGGEVGKYEKALQKAEMMGDAGYALPESLSAPAEEMSNMRPAEDLYGMYMRMGPQMVKDKMSSMESRALDSLLQQKMNNMDRPAVPQYGMGGMIDEYNMGGYVKKYQDGGEVEPQQVGIPPVDKFQQMAETWEDTGRGVESARAEQLRMAKFPADNYSGKEVQKNMNALAPYYKSFGRLKTPLQERNDFLYNRLNVNPNNLPSSLQGLKGSALLQRLGNEGI
jgi:hypothetical protein